MPAPMARPWRPGHLGEAPGCGPGNGFGPAFEFGGVGVGVVGDPGAVDGELGEEDKVAAGFGGLPGEGLDLCQVGVGLSAQGAEGDQADAHAGFQLEGFREARKARTEVGIMRGVGTAKGLATHRSRRGMCTCRTEVGSHGFQGRVRTR